MKKLIVMNVCASHKGLHLHTAVHGENSTKLLQKAYAMFDHDEMEDGQTNTVRSTSNPLILAKLLLLASSKSLYASFHHDRKQTQKVDKSDQ